MTADAFIAKWRAAELKERSAAQEHFIDLCRLLDEPMVSAGVDLYAVGRILGHRSVASSARYAHHSRDALLSAVEAGAAKLAAQPA